ncbi:MAG: hypothetical protein RL253_269, partial [Bacteroidota bacterium]
EYVIEKVVEFLSSGSETKEDANV